MKICVNGAMAQPGLNTSAIQTLKDFFDKITVFLLRIGIEHEHERTG